MFRSIVDRLDQDRDYPARQFAIDVYSRVLEGALYDHIPYGFHQEKSDAGEYIPLRDRRPSVRYNLCRLVVDDAVSLLFSEGHFPTPTSDATGAQGVLAGIVRAGRLNEVMIEAATVGSVGSVAVQMRVLAQKDRSHRIFFDVHATEFLTPVFDPAAPDTLLKLTERYKVRGSALRDQGYDVRDEDMAAMFWFSREWDDQAEIWFLPWLVNDEKARPIRDDKRSVVHRLGFVPWVWVRNLPGRLRLFAPNGKSGLAYSDVDGACTFAAAIDTMIEIEYLLSQGGRGLKYTADPLLIVKEPAANDDMVRSPDTALVVSEKGDAKLLEIGGASFGVVIDYAKALREIALESIHGNRSEASKLSAAQSGRAMELLNQALIWLADKLRTTYGEGALRALLRMALAAHAKFPISLDGQPLPAAPVDAALSLRWPKWYSSTASDRREQAQTLRELSAANHISRETAVSSIADEYDIEDVQAELDRIEQDRKDDLALIPEEGRTEQIKVDV